jgi:hypothetical protein
MKSKNYLSNSRMLQRKLAVLSVGAHELQELIGYSKWENFAKVIEKAKESCVNAWQKISDHFPDVRKMLKK